MSNGGVGRERGLMRSAGSVSAMSEVSPRSVGSRVVGADGMRALAALGVVLSHLYQRLQVPAESHWLAELQAIAVHGAYGVSVFFVLSGMLLSLPFWTAFLLGSAPPNISRYVRRRAARIIPAYYLSLTVSLALVPLIAPGDIYTLWRYLAGLTFTSGLSFITLFPVEVNPPLWSISFEVASYVLLPLMLVWFVRSSLGRAESIGGRARRGLMYWLCVVCVAVGLNGVLVAAVKPDTSDALSGHVALAQSWMPGYNPLGFFGHFAIGVLAAWAIAVWRASRAADPAGSRPARPLLAWRWDALAAVGILAAGLQIWIHRTPQAPNSPLWFQGQPYQYPFFALAIGLALVGLAHSRMLGRVADNRFFRYTAKVSFGLYVWHFLVIHLFSYLTGGQLNAGTLSPATHLAVSCAILVVAYTVATLSWLLVEQPVLRSRWATRS